MDRKNFIRNLLGTVAAVTIGKHLAPLAINPVEQSVLQSAADLPGTGRNIFTMVIHKGWFNQHDVITNADGREFYLTRRDDKLVAIDIQTGEPMIDIIETEVAGYDYDKENQFFGVPASDGRIYGKLHSAYAEGVDPWR